MVCQFLKFNTGACLSSITQYKQTGKIFHFKIILKLFGNDEL